MDCLAFAVHCHRVSSGGFRSPVTEPDTGGVPSSSSPEPEEVPSGGSSLSNCLHRFLRQPLSFALLLAFREDALVPKAPTQTVFCSAGK